MSSQAFLYENGLFPFCLKIVYVSRKSDFLYHSMLYVFYRRLKMYVCMFLYILYMYVRSQENPIFSGVEKVVVLNP